MSGPERPALLGARCPNHPDAAAVATCARCGTFLCGACTELWEESAVCEPCVALLRRSGRPSRGVQVTLVLTVLGVVTFPLVLCLPFPSLLVGLGGVWVGTRELRRIARGEAPDLGRTQARVTRVLGWVNLALVALWGAALGAYALWR